MLMKEAELDGPIFESDTFFRAVFYRNPEYALKTTDKEGKEKSREKSKEKILRAMGENPTITIQEIANAIGLSIAGVEKIIRLLKKSGDLRRIGPDKGGRWEIASKEELFANADANKK